MTGKPTLYAEDVLAWPEEPGDLEALARILPRRCGEAEWHDVELAADTLNCASCEGRGWLYPPMPDSYADPGIWQTVCERLWRHMGIMEGDDA